MRKENNQNNDYHYGRELAINGIIEQLKFLPCDVQEVIYEALMTARKR